VVDVILEVIFGALLFSGVAFAITSDIYKDMRELVRN
jgi:hypothetical protein